VTTALAVALLLREANWRAPTRETVAEAEHFTFGLHLQIDLGNAQTRTDQEISGHPSY